MSKKVGGFFWFRVAMMAIALSAVIWTIYTLNTPGARTPLEVLAGVPESSFNLCPTRVSSVSVVGRAAVFQDSLKWYKVEGGERRELDSVAVEKWFAHYCKVAAHPVPKPAGDSKPVVTLAYVAGSPVTLRQSADGVFSWQNYHFVSEALSKGLDELFEIPTR